MKEIATNIIIFKIRSAIKWTLFILIFLSISLYISLKVGLNIPRFEGFGLQVEKLYIKWDKKLNVQAQEIRITSNTSNNTTNTINFKLLRKIFNILMLNTKRIEIKTLLIDDFNATFLLKDGRFILNTPKYRVKTEIIPQDDGKILLPFEEVYSKKHKTFVKGFGVFDYNKNLLSAEGEYVLDSHIKGTVKLQLNEKGLSLFVDSKPFSNLSYLKLFLDLDEESYEWILTRNKSKTYTLKELSSTLDFDDLDSFYNNLIVDATIEDISYLFDTNLSMLRAQKAQLALFKDSLTIDLDEASYETHKLLKTQLSLSDLSANTHLKLNLLARHNLDKNLLKLLENYEVTLPFYAPKSHIQTKLHLDMELTSEKTDIKADFSVIKPSLVEFLGKTYTLHKGVASLRENKLSFKDLGLSYKKLFKSENHGELNVNTGRIEVKTKLLDFSYEGLKNKAPIFISSVYHNDTLLSHTKNAELSFSDFNITAKNIHTKLFNNLLELKKAQLIVDDTLLTKVKGSYSLKEDKAAFTLDTKKLNYIIEDTSLLSLQDTSLHLLFTLNKEGFIINIPELKTDFLKNGKLYTFYFHELENLFFVSDFLQQEKVDNGKATLTTKDFENFHLNLKSISHEDVIFQGDKPITNYNLRALINKKGVKLSVDDFLKATVKEKEINLILSDRDLHLDNLLKTTPSENTKVLNFRATNSNLLLDNKRKILTDNYEVQIDGNNTRAKLFYKEGQIYLEANNDDFEFYATDINDNFVKELSRFKSFFGGSFDLSATGEHKNYEAEFFIKESTLKDFALFNNVLAFLNTAPALLTFSNPGFNEDGYLIKDGYINYTQKADIITFKEIKLLGDSTNIKGEGLLNLQTKEIDFTLNLYTFKDLGNIINKIPIAGYLLLGDDDSISTTVRVKGTYDEPKVFSNLHKDMLLAPFNIIKRVFLLPKKALELFDENETKE